MIHGKFVSVHRLFTFIQVPLSNERHPWMTLRHSSSLYRQKSCLLCRSLETYPTLSEFLRPNSEIDCRAAFVCLNGLAMGSYIHTCGNLHESLLLAIQGTIAYAISPHAVLTDWTARTTSCGCIAVFDYKRNAQASDTLSSIEAHIGPGRLKRVGSLSQPKAPLKSAIESGKGLPRRTRLQIPDPTRADLPRIYLS